MHDKLGKLLSNIKDRKEGSNLTQRELSALKDLRKKPLVYLPSDKSGEFCIISQTEYDRGGESHLQDTETYTEIRKIQATTIENKINKEWHEVCTERKIPINIRRSYTTRNSQIPTF